MDEVILRTRFPRGSLPSRGFRCTTCGEELLLGEDAARLERLANELGLYGLENGRLRRLLRTGGSLAVTLDPELLREVVGHAKPGQQVRVGRIGTRIVIEAA